MSIETGLTSKLENDAGVAAIVGTRIYPVKLPQNPTLPAIVYTKNGGELQYTIGTQAVQLHDVEYEIVCWTKTYAQAHTLAKAVRTALDHQTGTWDDTKVIGVIFDSEEFDDFDWENDDFQVILDLKITHV